MRVLDITLAIMLATIGVVLVFAAAGWLIDRFQRSRRADETPPEHTN